MTYLVLGQRRLMHTRVFCIEDVHLHAAYLLRKDFLIRVTQIAEIHHISIVTVTVILADAGADKPPHQQQEYKYAVEPHEFLELRCYVDNDPLSNLEVDVETSLLMLEVILAEADSHSVDLTWLEGSHRLCRVESIDIGVEITWSTVVLLECLLVFILDDVQKEKW